MLRGRMRTGAGRDQYPHWSFELWQTASCYRFDYIFRTYSMNHCIFLRDLVNLFAFFFAYTFEFIALRDGILFLFADIDDDINARKGRRYRFSSAFFLRVYTVFVMRTVSVGSSSGDVECTSASLKSCLWRMSSTVLFSELWPNSLARNICSYSFCFSVTLLRSAFSVRNFAIILLATSRSVGKE